VPERQELPSGLSPERQTPERSILFRRPSHSILLARKTGDGKTEHDVRDADGRTSVRKPTHKPPAHKPPERRLPERKPLARRT
jgi:hypothetical protein